MNEIFPYVGNLGVFTCPDAQLKNYPSYGYNVGIGGLGEIYYISNSGTCSAMCETALAEPANILMICDCNEPYMQMSAGSVAYGSEYLSQLSYPSGGSMAMYTFDPFAIHSNGVNVAFADGHAKWVNDTDSKFADTKAQQAAGWTSLPMWDPYLAVNQ